MEHKTMTAEADAFVESGNSPPEQSETTDRLVDALEEMLGQFGTRPKEVMDVALVIYVNAVSVVLAETELEDWLRFVGDVNNQLDAVRLKLAERMTDIAPGKLGK